jgi:hypothetical protein
VSRVLADVLLALVNAGKERYFISFSLLSFRGSVQDYKIHLDVEIVTFA